MSDLTGLVIDHQKGRLSFPASNMTLESGSRIVLASTLQVEDGTATNPSITNQGDENTGLFFPAQEVVGVVGNGVVLILADGNTGKVTLTGNLYPNTTGTAGQVLTTNGAGTLSWTTPSSGGGGSSGLTQDEAILLSLIF